MVPAHALPWYVTRERLEAAEPEKHLGWVWDRQLRAVAVAGASGSHLPVLAMQALPTWCCCHPSTVGAPPCLVRVGLF